MVEALCLGEILVDWVCTTVGAELDAAQVFTKAAGGAPANTAVGLARQGVSTAFIGRVSDDLFGLWLKSVLEKDGIDVRGTISDAQAQTRMAYVVTTATGDRKLAEFTKIACADTRLQPCDLIDEQFEQASVLHFGSISLIENPAQEATARAIELARKHGVLVSYDPNIRIGLWETAEHCKNKILQTLHWGDIVKINEDELFFLSGSRELDAADRLRLEHNIGLLIITLDARGAYFTHGNGSKTVEGFQVKLLEATGAGDGFNSGVLCGLLPFLKKQPNKRAVLDALSLDQISEIINRANAVGALTCTKAGAIPALPTAYEIEEFLSQKSHKLPVNS
jgi:sugar/nucleoside kinase (ribokinase family)